MDCKEFGVAKVQMLGLEETKRDRGKKTGETSIWIMKEAFMSCFGVQILSRALGSHFRFVDLLDTELPQTFVKHAVSVKCSNVECNKMGYGSIHCFCFRPLSLRHLVTEAPGN